MKTAPNRRVLLAASFLLPAALTAVVFALCGMEPFGTRTMGVMDMAHQYLPFLYSLRDVLAGRSDLLYLPSMCLGGNMLGVAAYYLTSPLNLLCCLFPRESMYTAISLTYFLRVGLCGLTMCIYTGCRRGWSRRCLIPALAYALSAYMVGYCFNYLWQDCVILLPIVALGIARLREGRRPWLYVIALAAALILNFYIGYILCLFSALFFLYELFSVPRAKRERPWRTVLVFALSSVAAGALAACVLLPAAFALSGGKAEFSLSALTMTPQLDPVAMLSKLYVGAFNYEEIMPAGLPQIFTGTVTTALALLYFSNGRIPARRRILTGAFMLFLMVCFWLKGLDLIWHALNTPNWYNHRYSFLLCFLIAAAADAELAEFREGSRGLRLWLPIPVAAAVTALVFLGRTYAWVTWVSGLAAALITAAVCLLLWAMGRSEEKKRWAWILAAALILIHIGDIGANAKLSLDSLTVPASDSRSYAEYVTAKAAAFDLIDTDGTFIRAESTTEFNQDRCEPMLFGYDGISHYGSTISQGSLDLLERLGVDRYTDVWAVYGPGVTQAADTLLGIRYVVSETMDKPYAAMASAGNYTVWENENALPVGWTADAALGGSLAERDCFSYMNALYAAAAPEVGGSVFLAAEADEPEAEDFVTDDGRVYRLAGEAMSAKLTYAVVPAANGPLYLQIGLPDYPSVIVTVNGKVAAYYATAQTNGSLYLGDFAAGDAVSVTLQAFSDITVEFAAFATEDSDALSRYARALQEGGCALTKLSSSHFTGSFATGEGDGLLVLTIPRDESWHITLDGQDVQAVSVQDCFTAVPVGPGAHTLEMRYVPRGLLPGAAISAAALLTCLAVFIVQRRKEKQ